MSPVDSVIVPQSIFTTEIIQDSRVKTHSFLMSLLVDDGCSSGAHNEVRVEGKGRSLQQPHKKLKCENFPMEVLLLLYGLQVYVYTNTSMETTERMRKRKASISCSTYRYYFNSNGTNLLHGCCTLPPFPSTLMSLCAPVLVESIKSGGDTAMEPWLVDVYTYMSCGRRYYGEQSFPHAVVRSIQ